MAQKNTLAEGTDEYKRFSLLSKTIKVTLLGLAAVATLNGTFLSYDNSLLRQKDEKEVITIVYNRKASSKGLLIGGLNDVYGNFYGGMVGLDNFVRGDFYGISVNLLGFYEKRLTGINISFAGSGQTKKADSLDTMVLDKGLQISSMINYADTVRNGIQIGIVNHADNTEGFYLQLGIWNVNDEKTSLLINTGYKRKK